MLLLHHGAGHGPVAQGRENGIRIDYDCRSGICGQCKTKLVEGHVAMETHDALDPIDRTNQLILSCQARCLDAVVVDA